jgi:endonuclease-3
MPRLARPSDDPALQTKRVVRQLERLYPDANCALVHGNPYELLVATILSAQCTDARVNQVTPALFARYPEASALARADLAELEALIHSTGFFRAKAKNLVKMATQVVERHGGEIPRDLETLTALPGVGSKTANVVLGNAFGIASGVVVDTHVKRLAYRLGLTTSRDPVAIERDLMRNVPRKHWVDLSHRLITHGRKLCLAVRPRCADCPLEPICPKVGVRPPRTK